MSLQYIIGLLIALGLIFNATDYTTKSNSEQKELQKKAGIIEDNVVF